VSRVTHSLQTATRAARAGRGDEYVLCALLHDIGDTIGQFDHGLIAGAVVKPFVAPELRWMVENHADFQGYFFYEFIGADKDRRERFRGHPSFDLTAEFCEEYDEQAFDPTYPTEPIEFFAPLVQDLMAAPRYGSAVSGGVFIEVSAD
jgi:predicted HD phosphohydrolase